MELGELAKWNLVTVSHENTIEQALRKMNDANIHHIFVSDSSGPSYLISQSDIVTYILASSNRDASLSHSVDKIQHSDLKIFDQNLELGEAVNAMKEMGTDSLVIKSSDDTYGIVTVTDIMKVLEQILEKNTQDKSITQAEVTLANPFTQSLMKLLSDLGI